MVVLLDVGNSRLKLGWSHPTLGRESSVHAIALNPLDQLPALLGDWLARLPIPPREALGVNVAGSDVAALLDKTFKHIGCTLRWHTPQASQLDVHNTYTPPEQLGADRWAALLGLAGHFAPPHPPLVLATFGTATTIDTLSPDNHFIGGLILPGPALMRQSLAQGTANLPLASGAGSDYPTHTLQAISTGVVAAQIGAVWRQCDITQKRFDVAPVLCVSGGGWAEVEQEAQRMLAPLVIKVLPTPVLDGLARLI